MSVHYMLRDHVQIKKYDTTEAKVKKKQRSHGNIFFGVPQNIYQHHLRNQQHHI
jgi:hypothetical protein